MKPIKSLTLAAVIASVSVVSAFAEEFTKGTVKKVTADKGKVSVAHEELKNLEMPAMTMVFRTATPEILDQLKPGQQIEFVAERVNGKLTITKLK
ncbi:MAG: copper-binding protein [Rhizobiaceae bacterium]|jgi:Cu/Ag efflux protein CusF|nr:copper-binding protein [Rhizobiaceae bacterium]